LFLLPVDDDLYADTDEILKNEISLVQDLFLRHLALEVGRTTHSAKRMARSICDKDIRTQTLLKLGENPFGDEYIDGAARRFAERLRLHSIQETGEKLPSKEKNQSE